MTLDRSQVETIFPLTKQQESMLRHHLQDPVSDRGFLQLRGELLGPLERRTVEHAWRTMIARHAVLRTSVHWEALKHPVQVVHRDPPSIATGSSDVTSEEAMLDWVERDRALGLELDQAPMMRFALFPLGADRHAFLWSCHHILLDGWSGALLLGEFLERCRGAAAPAVGRIEAGPTAFADYCHWVRGVDRSAAAAFWKEAFAGSVAPPLVAKKSIHAFSKDGGGSLEVPLDRTSREQLRQLARELRTTVGTLTVGAWSLALSTFLGVREVVVGVTVSGRSAPFDDIAAMVGMFANTLPLRVPVDVDLSTGEFLRGIAARMGALSEYEWCSLSEIQEWSGLAPGSPIFDHFLAIANYPSPGSGAGGADELRLAHFQGAATSAYPLSAGVIDGDVPVLRLEYDPARMESRAVAWLAEAFSSILADMGGDGSRPVSALVAGLESPRPRPPEGEIQRVTVREEGGAPRDRIEGMVLKVWEEIFDRTYMSVFDDFFALGGSSLMAARLTARLGEVFEKPLPINTPFKARTVEALAALLRDQATHHWPIVIPLKTTGTRPPLFLIHEMGGSIFMYEEMARYLPSDQPLYAIQPPLDLCERIEALAERYLAEIRRLCPDGRFAVGGFCFGALVALEVAQRQRREGAPPQALMVIDFMISDRVRSRPGYLLQQLARNGPRQLGARFSALGRRAMNALQAESEASSTPPPFDVSAMPEFTQRMIEVHQRAVEGYKPLPFEGDVALIHSKSDYADYDPSLGWKSLVGGELVIQDVDFPHDQLMRGDGLRAVSRELVKALRRVGQES